MRDDKERLWIYMVIKVSVIVVRVSDTVLTMTSNVICFVRFSTVFTDSYVSFCIV
jgi:hypothetical protein